MHETTPTDTAPSDTAPSDTASTCGASADTARARPAMPDIVFTALPSGEVRALQAGARDANGMVPERTVSDGDATPCRHCLRMIPKGAGMLILAYRPFPALQPYAETGPIFLCADPCPRYAGDDVPPVGRSSPDYLVKGYTAEHRIRYGTGAVVPAGEMAAYAAALLACDNVAYLHVRSARNNCYQFRIDRAAEAQSRIGGTHLDAVF